MAQCWEHSPPTNVARVRILASTPNVGWVCRWFSPLLREVFLRVLRFSPLLKSEYFQVPIRSGTHEQVSTSFYELLSESWVNILQFPKHLQYKDSLPLPLSLNIPNLIRGLTIWWVRVVIHLIRALTWKNFTQEKRTVNAFFEVNHLRGSFHKFVGFVEFFSLPVHSRDYVKSFRHEKWPVSWIMTSCSSLDLPTLFQTILHFVLHKINDCFLQERKQQDVFVKLSIKHKKGSVLHPDIHYRPRSYLWNTSMQEFSSCSPNTEKVPIIIWWNTEHYCIKHENECFMGYPNKKST